MGNSVINIRAFNVHFKWDRGHWLPYFSWNPYHSVQDWPDGYFKVYDFPFFK